MKSIARLLLPAILVASLVAAGSPAVGEEARAETDKPISAETLQAVKEGGYVIYMRHGLSDLSTHDQVPLVSLADCSSQRNLTAEGRFQVANVGKAIKRLRIPVGEVLTSPYCRTRDTAGLAFGKGLVSHALITTANLTEQEKAPIAAELRSLLGRPVPPGSNRVLVSHSSTLADATGIFPKPQGVILVFRPDGNGGFRHVATIAPSDWEKIGSPRR